LEYRLGRAQWRFDRGGGGAKQTLQGILETLEFCYARRRGYDFEQARDLTQEFFARLLEKEQLRHVTHQEGKFRSFLLTLMNHFLSDEHARARALKRGGDQTPVFLDALSEEERYRVEPSHGATPEQLFDLRWAQTVIEKAAQRLREEYEVAGKGALFETLQSLPHGLSSVVRRTPSWRRGWE
jgi:RNA polymerase sigma-70 factor (ECF subfamily)